MLQAGHGSTASCSDPHIQCFVINGTCRVYEIDYLSVVSNTTIVALSLPALSIVQQGLTINSNAVLQTVDFPSLMSADSMQFDSNPAMVNLVLPALTRCRALEIGGNTLLQSINLPALVQINDTTNYYYASLSLYVHDNPALVALDVPVLKYAKAVTINNNVELASTVLPSLVNITNSYYSTLHLLGNSKLQLISCPVLETIEGAYYASSALSLDFPATLSNMSFPALRSIPNALSFSGSGLTSIDFHSLQSCGGLSISGTAQSSIDFHSLQSCGALSFSGTGLTSIAFPALTSAGTSLSVTSNAVLQSISFPLLSGAGFGITINGNPALIALNANALFTDVDSLAINSNAALPALSLPTLASCRLLEIGGNTLLQSINLPALVQINDTANDYYASSSLYVHDNPALVALDVPVLKYAKAVTINNNVELASVVLPSLVNVTDSYYSYLQITGNTNLQLISCPVLETIGSAAGGYQSYGLHLDYPATLANLSFPALRSIPNALSFTGSALSSIDFHSLQSCVALSFSGTGLTSIAFPILATAGSLSVTSNSALHSFSCPVLPATGSVYFYANPALVSVHFDALCKVASASTFSTPGTYYQCANPCWCGTLTTNGATLATVPGCTCSCACP
jgi:hypothetical protein